MERRACAAKANVIDCKLKKLGQSSEEEEEGWDGMDVDQDDDYSDVDYYQKRRLNDMKRVKSINVLETVVIVCRRVLVSCPYVVGVMRWRGT